VYLKRKKEKEKEKISLEKHGIPIGKSNLPGPSRWEQ
jgi:hypothetical protein